ncbi:MAG: efflux RND transporter permease subunit, partial [Bryobacteraceae bacterium]
ISVSLVAVFIPILLMPGIVGRLFREFAVTLSVAIAVSLVISLTATPMMCAKLLRTESHQKHGRLYRASDAAFHWVVGGYGRTLFWVLKHQLLILLVTISTLGLTVYLYVIIPKGFFPQQDNGHLVGQIIADQDTSFQAMRHLLVQITRTVAADPAVENVNAYNGGRGGTANQGRMFAILKPLGERKLTTDQVIGRLRGKLGKIPGATLYLQASQDLRIGGHSSAAQYQYTLEGDNLDDLNQWAPRMYRTLRTLPGLVDVNSDQQNRGLEASLVIDRNTAQRMGISSKLIDDTLYDAFGQRQVSTMYTQLNQYHVVMEVEPRFWQNPGGLKYIYVRANNGRQVPLSAFTHYAPSTAALAVNHQGQFPAITISFNLIPGFSLGDAVTEIQDAEATLRLPVTVHGSFQGTAQAFRDSLNSEPILIAAALITVYIVLGILYESYIHPVTILSTLPSAGVGALLALLLTRTELSVIALIGIILLIGIVKKNAILMIDFAIETERRNARRPEEAIYEACLLRFRPIMMTTMAALLGGLPIALSHGNGSEIRRPLGIAICGGLIVSQMLTLYTTPVIY